MLPFSTQQFLEVFAAYNEAIWPLQIGTQLPGISMTGLLFVPHSYCSRAIGAILAVLWVTDGTEYRSRLALKYSCAQVGRIADSL